jgi:hypothetical protein
MKQDLKAIQITPAEGWYALFFDDTAPHSKIRRVLSFVLLQDKDGQTRIDAAVGDLQYCLAEGQEVAEDGRWQSPHFVGFFHETEITEKLKVQWSNQATEFVKRKPVQAQ